MRTSRFFICHLATHTTVWNGSRFGGSPIAPPGGAVPPTPHHPPPQPPSTSRSRSPGTPRQGPGTETARARPSAPPSNAIRCAPPPPTRSRYPAAPRRRARTPPPRARTPRAITTSCASSTPTLNDRSDVSRCEPGELQRVAQRERKPEAVHEAEEARHDPAPIQVRRVPRTRSVGPEALPAVAGSPAIPPRRHARRPTHRAHHVLERHEHDRGGDERLDERREPQPAGRPSRMRMR